MEYTDLGNDFILFHNAIKDPQKYHEIIMSDQECHTMVSNYNPSESVALDRSAKHCPFC